MSLVPYVVEQTARGERSYDIFSRLLNDRIIVLSEDVNPNSASVIIAQLLYLEGQDPEKDISFYINSPGGSITDGMAIHDTMKYIGQGGGLSGQASDIQIHANHLVQIKKKMNRMLSEYTGQPLEVVEKDTDRDNYLTAEEAKAYGLIDEIIVKH